MTWSQQAANQVLDRFAQQQVAVRRNNTAHTKRARLIHESRPLCMDSEKVSVSSERGGFTGDD